MSELVSYENIGDKDVVVTIPEKGGHGTPNLKGVARHIYVRVGETKELPRNIGERYKKFSLLPVKEAAKRKEPEPEPSEPEASGSVSTEEPKKKTRGRKRGFLGALTGTK